MTVTMTRMCPVCGNEIPPSNYHKVYCGGLCRRRQNKRTQDARKRAMRGQIEREATVAKQRKAKGETASIVHDPDRENRPGRVSKMTEAEFDGYLARLRVALDAQPRHANDGWYRLSAEEHTQRVAAVRRAA